MKDSNNMYSAKTQTTVSETKRTLVDQDTGEVMLVDQIIKRVYGTKQFWKVYLTDFLSILGIIDSKQLDVFIYIVEHTSQSDNLFIGTYDEISKATNASQPTIAKIMKKLQEHNFIKHKQKSVYIVNPNILMKGNDNKRQILLQYFSDSQLNENNK